MYDITKESMKLYEIPMLCHEIPMLCYEILILCYDMIYVIKDMLKLTLCACIIFETKTCLIL